jgi:signal transduction histidine kinase
MRNSLYFLDRLLESAQSNPETWRRYLDKMNGEIDRQTKIINDLLFFSRNRPRQLAEVDVNAIIQDALHRTAPPDSVAVELDLAADPGTVRGDADQLLQVFVNLISNAIQAMPGGGRLAISTQASEFALTAIVADSGVGIPARIWHGSLNRSSHQEKVSGWAFGDPEHHRGTPRAAQRRISVGWEPPSRSNCHCS